MSTITNKSTTKTNTGKENFSSEGQWVAHLSSFGYGFQVICQKTSASLSSEVPDTEKQMKAPGRRPSAFIVSKCLESLMKHEARVFDMTSQTSVRIYWNYFRKIGN